MLTRLRVKGFKNLIDTDVRFGAFTCIAGMNGTGKSNLFDAISFLSHLAEKPLLEAARSVRARDPRTGDLNSLFNRVADSGSQEVSFEVEMIVPKQGVDDLSQDVKANATFLRYKIVLALEESPSPAGNTLVLREETLQKLKKREISQALKFELAPPWKNSVIAQGHRNADFISTIRNNDGKTTIQVHQDGGGGKPRPVIAGNLQRTLVSASGSAEFPTVALARREMQSWRMLQLEPSSLRASSNLQDPTSIASDGSNLAATLYRLLNENGGNGKLNVQQQITNRLTELLEDARTVDVLKDDARELLTVVVKDKQNTSFPARSLSDGTLRFLALAVMGLDPDERGVICLEEPENGIHPARIAPMLRLLTDIAVDTKLTVDNENPLRQVIISTHSPAIVQQVNEDDLVFALREEIKTPQGITEGVVFRTLAGTWRASDNSETVTKGRLLAYLHPSEPEPQVSLEADQSISAKKPRRVIDRSDIRQMMFEGFKNAS